MGVVLGLESTNREHSFRESPILDLVSESTKVVGFAEKKAVSQGFQKKQWGVCFMTVSILVFWNDFNVDEPLRYVDLGILSILLRQGAHDLPNRSWRNLPVQFRDSGSTCREAGLETLIPSSPDIAT